MMYRHLHLSKTERESRVESRKSEVCLPCAALVASPYPVCGGAGIGRCVDCWAIKTCHSRFRWGKSNIDRVISSKPHAEPREPSETCSRTKVTQRAYSTDNTPRDIARQVSSIRTISAAYCHAACATHARQRSLQMLRADHTAASVPATEIARARRCSAALHPNWRLAIGNWQLATGNRRLVIGDW
jgi:hypothetical protein